MKKLILSFFCTLLLSGFYSQENLSKSEATEYAEMFNNAGGTYQFQMIDTREKPTIPLSYIQTIEDSRDDNEIIYLPFKENIRVKILPQNLVTSGKYETLERFAYINSTDL